MSGSEPAGHIELRPIRDDDREFLYRVYASTREEELAVVAWSEAEKAAFLRAQFDAQDRHYQAHCDTAGFTIVCLEGVPVGRLYLHRSASEIRIVDVALLPPYRRRGIGERLLRSIFAEADAACLGVSIHVEVFNPARRLYERLGFGFVVERGAYLLMRRDPLIQSPPRSASPQDRAPAAP
jgi:ribosomal protein S18 acetylase RimI-like enzyme